MSGEDPRGTGERTASDHKSRKGRETHATHTLERRGTLGMHSFAWDTVPIQTLGVHFVDICRLIGSWVPRPQKMDGRRKMSNWIRLPIVALQRTRRGIPCLRDVRTTADPGQRRPTGSFRSGPHTPHALLRIGPSPTDLGTPLGEPDRQHDTHAPSIRRGPAGWGCMTWLGVATTLGWGPARGRRVAQGREPRSEASGFEGESCWPPSPPPHPCAKGGSTACVWGV